MNRLKVIKSIPGEGACAASDIFTGKQNFFICFDRFMLGGNKRTVSAK